MKTISAVEIKVADEVWVVTALLHKDQVGRPDFTIEEIVDRAKQEKITGTLRPGVYQHVVQHCVANRPPNSGRYRILFETAAGRRRLFRTGDSYDPAREGAKTAPERDDIPSKYQPLVDWYRDWNQDDVAQRIKNDPLLALMGSGKELWADEHTDEYVRRIREGWE